jgi:hypothetical protein
MSTLKISDGVVKDEVLVLGLTSTNSKGGIAIEAGDMAIDTKTILSQLVHMCGFWSLLDLEKNHQTTHMKRYVEPQAAHLAPWPATLPQHFHYLQRVWLK